MFTFSKVILRVLKRYSEGKGRKIITPESTVTKRKVYKCKRLSSLVNCCCDVIIPCFYAVQIVYFPLLFRNIWKFSVQRPMVSHKNSIFILFKGSQTMKKTVLESGISASNAISYCFLIEQTARQLDVVFPCVKKKSTFENRRSHRWNVCVCCCQIPKQMEHPDILTLLDIQPCHLTVQKHCMHELLANVHTFEKNCHAQNSSSNFQEIWSIAQWISC